MLDIFIARRNWKKGEIDCSNWSTGRRRRKAEYQREQRIRRIKLENFFVSWKNGFLRKRGQKAQVHKQVSYQFICLLWTNTYPYCFSVIFELSNIDWCRSSSFETCYQILRSLIKILKLYLGIFSKNFICHQTWSWFGWEQLELESDWFDCSIREIRIRIVIDFQSNFYLWCLFGKEIACRINRAVTSKQKIISVLPIGRLSVREVHWAKLVQDGPVVCVQKSNKNMDSALTLTVNRGRGWNQEP